MTDGQLTIPELIRSATVKAIEDPLVAITHANGMIDILDRIAPTFPWEFPVPIPRKLYEKLKEMK
jgi:hypothetical protein